MAGPAELICAGCHADVTEPPEAASIHAPAQGDCLQCHLPHGGDGMGMLVESTPALCFNCHDEQNADYRAKHLDKTAFQEALKEALATRGNDPSKRLTVKVDGEVETDCRGRLRVRPSEQPTENALFHDGTNMSIERQMADLAETGMMNDLATTLLRGRFEALHKAIRGSVG